MSQNAAMDHHYTSTGIPHRKLLMWTFIGSECMLFGSLITGYLVYRGRSLVGPYPIDLLNIPFITVTTFVLLMSSLAMVLALSAVQRGRKGQARLWLAATAILGLIFLGGQVYEFSHFVHEGLGLTRNMFSATFFLLTGTHGAHVAIGVVWLSSLLVQSFRGKLGPEKAEIVEVAGLYWHFVDVVWIVLFTVIYLLVEA
ncbi:MAG TPA: cytochrome c oxidase subunit 3 [Gemmatimonadota bacterium]|nr:cytochrome c oxidase subunit 3 [Gemmatimonadota bacterium]